MTGWTDGQDARGSFLGGCHRAILTVKACAAG